MAAEGSLEEFWFAVSAQIGSDGCVVFVVPVCRVNECDGEAKVTWIFTSKAHESTAQIKAHQVSKSSGQPAAHRCPPSMCV